jgi:hypothetical protein
VAIFFRGVKIREQLTLSHEEEQIFGEADSQHSQRAKFR